MQRYTNTPPRFEIRSSASEIEPATQEKPILKRKMLKLHKYTQLNTQTLNTLNSQDDDPPNGNKIAFKLERKRVSKDMPGVGQYDISIPIVKPAYQTYQKSNEVVLVKINHIGGTSSFRSEEDRFNQGGQSIYIPSLTPGPGTYDSLTKRKQKERHSKPYSETYNIIHDMIMQNRQTIESIPNYCLPSKAGLKYNGMPKHLQDMYHKLDRARVLANSYRDTSLQLKDLHKIKQEREAMPMKSVEQPEPFAYWDIEKEKSRTIPRINQKLTETMCRFEQQKKKETERAQKIEAILQYQKKRSFSVERSSVPKQHNQKESRVMKQRYNQNMVNILFGQKNKRQYHKDKHCAL